jgi:hypothetical protein
MLDVVLLSRSEYSSILNRLTALEEEVGHLNTLVRDEEEEPTDVQTNNTPRAGSKLQAITAGTLDQLLDHVG